MNDSAVPFDRSRRTLEQHSLDMRQFADCRESVLSGGMRIVDVYNSSGLSFTVLPDRGMDIWTAHYRGVPLTWISPGSPHRPDHGSPWLRQFNGGLLTTCGLRHAGPPEVDDETGEGRDIHGHYTRLPAEVLQREGWWEDGAYVMELKGRVSQTRLFGEQLRLERTIRVTLHEPALEIRDVVTNLADAPSPFMLLYHFNLGYPLVCDGARFHTASHAVLARDAEADKGLEDWNSYTSARPGYAEQVFYHHVMALDGTAGVALASDELGILLTWDVEHAPYLTQWKNVRQGIYVSGIEPGNCLPEGQNAARAGGRLVTLQPGETQGFRSRLEVLDGGHAVEAALERLAAHQASGHPVEEFRWARAPGG